MIRKTFIFATLALSTLAGAQAKPAAKGDTGKKAAPAAAPAPAAKAAGKEAAKHDSAKKAPEAKKKN